MDLPDLELRRGVPGIQRQFGFELRLRLGQRFRAVRLQQDGAAQPEVQVERPRIFPDGLAVFRRPFGELVLGLEDFGGELVDAVGGRGLLKHAPRGVVEGPHVNAGER